MPLSGFDPAPRNAPEPGVFELGLVLTGAPSAGAYLAGALDAIIEALDAWEQAKALDRAHGTHTVPNHQTVLRVVGGSAAGGMTAGLLATLLGNSFPPVNAARAPAEPIPTGNPLFDAWVNDVDIRSLQPGAGRDEAPAPWIAGAALERLATRFFGPSLSHKRRREWVSDPLHVLISPGTDPASPETEAELRRFECEVGGLHAAPSADSPGPGVRTLHQPPGSAGWEALAQAALAALTAPRAAPKLSDRVANSPRNAAGTAWEKNATTSLAETADLPSPLALTRECLAGGPEHNSREGVRASRALLLIDPSPDDLPFGSAAAALQPGSPALAQIGLGAPGSEARNDRFSTEDLALAHDENVYSRFILKPDRGSHNGASAPWHLASAALNGLAGFLDREYRRHDYLLGRRNAEWFLRHHFALPPENPLFAGWRGDPALYARFRILDPQRPGRSWLPIIPVLTPKLSDRESPPNPCPLWPSERAFLDELKRPLARQLEALASRPADASWWRQIAAWAARPARRNAAWRAVRRALEQALAQHRL